MSFFTRAGSASEGVQNLASSRGGTAQEVYLMDCSFNGHAMSMQEVVNVKGAFGILNVFGGA